jgi:ribosomal protein L21
MAKTEDGKKIVPVKPYKKKDGTKVPGHRRSTPN